jgi:hypothetical protein
MARFKVIAARVMEGGNKTSFAYAIGDELDEADDILGHIPRLDASGALERLPDEVAAAPAPDAGAVLPKRRRRP